MKTVEITNKLHSTHLVKFQLGIASCDQSTVVRGPLCLLYVELTLSTIPAPMGLDDEAAVLLCLPARQPL